MTGNVKSTMAQDARKAKLLEIIAPLKMKAEEASKLVDGLVEKYGNNARDLTIALMNRPYEVMPILTDDKNKYLSRAALQFVNDKVISVENLAKMLKKEKSAVAQAMPAKENTSKNQSVMQDRNHLKKDLANAASATKIWFSRWNSASLTPFPLNSTYKERQEKLTTAVNKRAKNNQLRSSSNNVLQSFRYEKPKWQPKEINIDKKSPAEEAYHNAGAETVVNRISLDNLMKKAGVKPQDIQTLIDKNNSLEVKAGIINQIIPGRKNRLLASAADKTTGTCHGDCLTGVQRMFVPYLYTDRTSPLSAVNPVWKKYTKKDHSNEASDARYVLDNSEDFVTISVKNEAYAQPAGSPGNAKMKKFNRSLPPGTIASTGRCSEGSRGHMNKGSAAGHIWVKDNKGRSCSDGVQLDGPRDFNSYGENMYITLSRDSYIPKEMALQLISIAQARQARETQLAQNAVNKKQQGA